MDYEARATKVVVVSGVRPHFIKCAALRQAIVRHNSMSNAPILAKYVNTGQHYDEELAGAVINDLELHFDHMISHPSSKPIHVLGGMIVGVYEYLEALGKKPDWVVIFGDANSSLAGAIAAAKARCRIAHFEAGAAIRDVDTPEVINSRIISHLVTAHFCISAADSVALCENGITEKVFVIGDIARDFVLAASDQLPNVWRSYRPGTYTLLTLHHEENLESERILRNLLETLPEYGRVVFVMHPRTRKQLQRFLLLDVENVDYLPALPYRETLAALKNCKFLVTDSGGLQREAYYLQKRCLVRLEVDYWPSLTSRVHRLIGTEKTSIVDGLEWMMESLEEDDYPEIEEFGTLNAAESALSVLTNPSL